MSKQFISEPELDHVMDVLSEARTWLTDYLKPTTRQDPSYFSLVENIDDILNAYHRERYGND